MKKNIILFVIVLVVSYFTAQYFGALYDKFSPQYGSAFWGLDKSGAISFVGFFVAYAFFVPFLFELFGARNKKKWMMWLLVPPALLWLSADIYYIYLPIILAVIAFLLAKFIRFIISKLRRPQLR